MVNSPTTTTYCTPEDVRRLLASTYTFTDTSMPLSNEDIRKFITAAESRINKITRHSWKEVRVVEEYYDLPTSFKQFDNRNGIPIFLNHRAVKTFTTGGATPDKIEVWDGSNYTDYVADKTAGRGDDWWANYADGIVYLRISHYYYERDAVRMTYRYGETSVPEDIRDCCAQLAASQLIINDDRSMLMDKTDTQQASAITKAERLEKLALKTLADYAEPYAV